jgi:hypothetical protein
MGSLGEFDLFPKCELESSLSSSELDLRSILVVSWSDPEWVVISASMIVSSSEMACGTSAGSLNSLRLKDLKRNESENEN